MSWESEIALSLAKRKLAALALGGNRCRDEVSGSCGHQETEMLVCRAVSGTWRSPSVPAEMEYRSVPKTSVKEVEKPGGEQMTKKRKRGRARWYQNFYETKR